MKSKIFISLVLFLLPIIPSFALSRCPNCGYTILSSQLNCSKCLLNLSPELSQDIPTSSIITVRNGYDAFIRHPHADNRAYKSDRNAGGDKTGEIGVWGGPCTLRYLLKFNILEAMNRLNINPLSFTPKKATLHISAIPKKSNIQMPIAIFPLTKHFTAGTQKFRLRSKNSDGCTWFKATPAMPWDNQGGDYDPQYMCKGVIKSGVRNEIDITKIIQYFFEISRKNREWNVPGLLIMSDPTNPLAPSGFVTIYSLDASDYSLRPELFIK